MKLHYDRNHSFDGKRFYHSWEYFPPYAYWRRKKVAVFESPGRRFTIHNGTSIELASIELLRERAENR